MLWPSAYNFVQPYGDEVLLFNTRTLYFGRMAAAHYAAVEKAMASWRGDPACKPTDESIRRIAFELRQSGFLVEDREEEVQSIISRFVRQKASRQHFGLTIAPTDGCNFACPYCYEHLNFTSMSIDMQKQVADFIERNIVGGDFTSMHITWYGGEPLTPQSLAAIEYLSKRIIQTCEQHNVAYSANIISNGYLLTRSVAEMLAEQKVSLMQVTLDGPAQQHDKTRVLKSGAGTFDRIIENIRANLDLLRYSIRMNVSHENADSIVALKDYLRQNGILGDAERATFYVSPVRSYTTSCRSAECMTNAEFYKLQLELLKQGINDDGFPVVEDYPTSKESICTAVGEDSFVIGPSGDLYKCWLDLGRNELSVGNIAAGECELNAGMEKWRGFNPFNEANCGLCTMLPVCMGGCPELNMRSNGEPENQACCNWKYFLKDHLLHIAQQAKTG